MSFDHGISEHDWHSIDTRSSGRKYELLWKCSRCGLEILSQYMPHPFLMQKDKSCDEITLAKVHDS